MARSIELKGLEATTVIVTGDASGIGRAIAARLCDEGAHVCIFDRDAEGAARAASELRENRGEIAKGGAHQVGAVAESREPIFRRRDRVRVHVQRDQATLGADAFQDRGGVAAAAHGPVDDDATWVKV